MLKKIIEDLDELLDMQVIDQDTAEKIRLYYQDQEGEHKNRQYVIFGILGALLVGLGIVLIVAHNWDNLSRTTKTVLGFTPLLLAQSLSVFTMVRKRADRTWRESSTTLLVFGLGATISLISQIYNIPGTVASFMLTWTLLILPLIYLMPSTMAAVLYLIGITYYGAETGYNGSKSMMDFYFWILLIPVLPHYLSLLKNNAKSNFTYLLNWLLPIAVIINLGSIAHDNPQWLFATYFILFGLYYFIGKHVNPFHNSLQNNGYRALGSIGSVVLLTILSFHFIWKEIATEPIEIASPEAIFTILLFIVLSYLIVRFTIPKIEWPFFDPSPFIPVIFLVLFIAFRSAPIFSVVVINIILFLLALYTIRRAMQLQHLGLLNYGLLMITALIICRFFDTNISFILRGLLFVIIGIGFFITNYRLIKTSR